MYMIPVESSQISAIGHDPKTNTLAILFTSKTGPGSLYHYANFTEEDFAAFRAAGSIGAYFGKRIKPEVEKHPFTKVSEATVADIVGLIDGIQYAPQGPLWDKAVAAAKEAGIVIVYGSSDDLAEFEGAFSDEFGGPGEFLFDQKGVLDRSACDTDEEIAEFVARKQKAQVIESIWDKDGYSWVFETTIPHSTFTIYDGIETYCRGIVFRLADV